MDYNFETTTLEQSLIQAASAETATLRLYDIFIPLLGIFIILLNSIVVNASGLLIEKRQQPRSCYILLGNLGLSNLLTGIAVLFGHYYPSRNDTSCAIQIGMIVSSSLVSVFSVLLVAIDRFLYISNGLRYQQYMFPNRVRFLIVISWIIGSIIGFLPLMAPSLRGTMSGDQCWFILLNSELVLATTTIGTIPIFIVVILYSIILKKALKKVGELKKATSFIATTAIETGDNNLRIFRGSTVDLRQTVDRDQDTTAPLRKHSKSKSLRCFWCCSSSSKTYAPENIAMTMTPRRQPSRWKAIKIVMFTTGSFVITWVPYFIVSTMYVYCDHENNPSFCNGLKYAIASPLAILGFANSLLNPIIYAWWHNGFRTNVTRIYARRFERIKWCRWCFNKSNDSATLSPRTTNLSSTSNLSSGTTNTTTVGAIMADVNEMETQSPVTTQMQSENVQS
ncbi:hypothetical protein ACKWTF_011342 [Chironomus riparius]